MIRISYHLHVHVIRNKEGQDNWQVHNNFIKHKIIGSIQKILKAMADAARQSQWHELTTLNTTYTTLTLRWTNKSLSLSLP